MNTPSRKKRFTCIIPYNSNVKILWDWFILILVLYTAVQIPYQAAFPSKTSNSSKSRGVFQSTTSPLIIAGYIVDGFFLLDLFVNFLTSYPKSETEEIITDHRKIAIHYLKTWFTVDFIAVIPFDWFIDEVRPESEDVSSKLMYSLQNGRQRLSLCRLVAGT